MDNGIGKWTNNLVHEPILILLIILFLQTTIALSKIATSSIPWSLANLRRSLGVIVIYADNDEGVKVSHYTLNWKCLKVYTLIIMFFTPSL